MPDDVAEVIVKHVETTIKGIVPPTYTYDLSLTTQRFRQGGVKTVNTPAAFILTGPEVLIDDDEAGNGDYQLVSVLLNVRVLLIHRLPEDAAMSGDEYMNGLRAAVIKAMLADPSRGTHAITTEELGSSIIKPEEGVPSLNRLVDFAINYRRKRQDPYSEG